MKNISKKVLSILLLVSIIASSFVVTTFLQVTAEGSAVEYDFARQTGYDSFATTRYNEFYSENRNILQGLTVHSNRWGGSFAPMPDAHTTSLNWATVTDGSPSKSVFMNQPCNVYPQMYFELTDITEISHFTFFNYANRATMEASSFDVFVANDTATLWNASNIVIDYDIAAETANHTGTVILEFVFKEGKKPVGKYIGIRFNSPYNRGDTNAANNVLITEIAAAGKAVRSITATAGEGGAISPSGTQTVQTGSNATYTITPDSGYNIKDVLVDGVSVGAVSSYTFENVTENHTITASFAGAYTITKTSGYGSTAQGLYDSLVSTYGENILKNKSVYARQSYYTSTLIPKEDTDSLKWSNITNGAPKADDSGVVAVPTVNVDENGGLHDIGQQWYFELSALTEIEQIAIFNHVASNNDLQLCNFEIYVADDVTSLWDASNKVVDYTLDTAATNLQDFNNIQIKFSEKPQGRYLGFYWPYPCEFRTKTNPEKTGDCNIVRLTEIAAFGKQINTITATAGEGGTISPSGETSVMGGQNAVYTITANNGSYISKLLVDGAEVPEAVGKTEYTYTFSAVSANHTISVEFVTPYSFTNEFVSSSDLTDKYNDLLTANGENLLSGKTPYGYASKSANNYDYNYIDKSATWGVLTDGNATKESSVVIEGFWGNVYFELDNIVDLNKLVLFNSFSGMRDGLQIQNFDVFVGNNPDTLWDKGNIVASYNASQVSASGNAKVITLDFNQDGLAKGKYLGICWKAPYNFETSSSIVLTEILAFGEECATVVADANGSGTVSSYDAIELDSDVEYVFTPDKGYKVVDVFVDSESVGARETLTVTKDDNSHKVEVEFAIIGDTDNNHNLDADDVVNLRKTLLDIGDFCEDKYADVNGDSGVDICDLVRTAKVFDNMEYDEDITMLAEGLGLDYFDIQDALERGDDLNNISDVNTARVQQVMQKAMKGEPITLSVIGGSITEGAFNSTNSDYASEEVNKHFGNKSYAEWVQKWFADEFYNGDTSKVTLVNAGIGSTTSLLGSFRLQSMVLDKNPDLVIVEFSVNDFATIAFRDSVIYLGDGAYEAYESIVRRCLEADVAVMQLFMGHTKERGLWTVHRVIGSYYNVPMVSFENAVYPNDSCILSDTTRVYKDGMHPNNVGHAFLGKVISNYLDKIYADTDSNTDYTASTVPTECVYGDTYANAKNTILYAVNNKDAVTGSFTYDAEESSKWGGAYVNDGTAEGTITATIPAGVKKVYVLYDVEASTSGSFTTKLGENDNVEVNYEYEGLPIWSTVYSADALTEDTNITLTSSSSGLNVIGFMLQY